jgi:hypothetical protein
MVRLFALDAGRFRHRRGVVKAFGRDSLGPAFLACWFFMVTSDL